MGVSVWTWRNGPIYTRLVYFGTPRSCKLALHNIHTITYDIENKEGTYMYGMKSVHYGFPLER